MTTQDQKPPDRIYLQADSQGGYEIGRDATWCDHRIDDEDVEYVLASEPESVGPKLQGRVDRVLTFLKRVGPMVALRGSKESNDALDDIPKLLAILATHAKPPEPNGIDQALSDAHDVGWANASGRQIRTKALLKESQVAAVMTGRTTLELALRTPEARETVGWIPAQKNHASPVKTDYYIIPIRYIRLGHHPTPTGDSE